jgi:tetratricopeptide (TPR) repeat protein
MDGGASVTRVARRKLLWFGGLVALMAGAAVMFRLMEGPFAIFAAALVALIPGRIQRTFYRDLFASRRTMSHGRYAESAEHSRRFLADIRERPGLKRLMWIAWPGRTVDAEAMALNNLGGAQVELGEWDAASRHLEEAIRIDPEYSIPRFNLALIAAVSGDRATAERLLGEARAKGYAPGSIDALMRHADELRTRFASPAAV